MLFKKQVILLLFAFFFVTALHAQKQFTAYDALPGLIKSYKPRYSKNFPEWAKMLYKDSINFKQVDALFKNEEGDGMEEKAEKETAIKRYFILWRKAVMPYVRKDGNIVLPSAEDLQRRQQFIQKQQAATQQPGTIMGDWTFAGPKETWWQNDGSIYTHNETPWQVNVYSFDVAPSNSNILYAGTETGFINKTTDKGLHWQLAGVNYHFGGAITAIVIDPFNPDIVYAAAGNQIHKSTNGGSTWQAMLTGVTSFYADRIKIDKNNSNKLYAVAANGFYTSTNAGISWTQKWANASWDIELKPDNSNIVYVLTSRVVSGKDVYKIFISKDGGQTFIQDNNFSYNNEINTGGLLAVTPADPTLIFAAVLTDPQPKIYKGVYSNIAGTTTWGLKATGGSSQLPADNWQGYYDLVFDVSPMDVNTVYFGTSGLYKSTNGGTSFKSIYDYGQPEVIPIHPDAQDFKLVNGQEGWVSTDGGLTYSTDAFSTGVNAYARNNGIVGSDFWGFDQGWNEDLMVGGRYHNGNTAVGEFYSDKALRLGGAESPTGWILPGQSRHAAFDDLGDGHILPPSLTAIEEGTFPFTKFPGMYYYGYRRGGFLTHPNYYNTFFVSNGNAIWKSTDAGASFTLLYDFGNEVWQIQICRTNPNVMYADTKAGLYRSADGGNTWIAKPSLTHDPYGYDWWQGNLSVAVSPFNENVLYACPQQNWPDNSRKIFRSADGGNTWTDWTTATIHDYGTKWLAIQPMPGNKDGIYLFTNYSWDGTIGGKVFFRSEDMGDWTDYSNNYPTDASIDFAAAMPFYRDGKLRAAGNMGIWETPLYEPNFPVTAINPMVDKSGSYGCARDTFYFDDYSIVNHLGTQWEWAFNPAPAYISDTHARNPKVVFANAAKYAVTETITQNGKTYSRTINDMVDISGNICGTIDTVPGKAASFAGAQFASIAPLNITTNNFTLSFWVKPDASQSDWAGLVLTSGAPKIGLNVLSTLELRYNWNDSYWWNETGLFLTPNKWNHLAMVIEPNKTTIYLNGIAKVFNETNDALNLISSFQVGKDGNYDDRYFKGQADELCFFNRAVPQNEIREQMHLIKNTASDNSLIHYYQFNENSGTVAYDKVGLNHLQMGASTYSTSTVPVGAGVSKRVTVNTAGSYTFDNTGLKITFPAGTQPNGELCVTRINQNAQNSSSTNNGLLFGRYWIVNNYGTNKTFTNLSSIGFDDCGAVSASEIINPSQIKLFKRGSFDDASTSWLQAGMASQVVNAGSSSNISFTAPSVTSFSQFQLQRTDAVLALQTITLHAELLTNKNIGVTWETFGEEAIDNYIIERSTDGIHFTALGKQSAINTSGTHKYNYVDAKPVNGVLYYRIKVLHKNESISYSSIVNITVKQQFSLFEVYPNPLAPGQLLKTSVYTSEPYQLHIYNAQGEEIYSQKHTGNAQIKLKKIPVGVYFYSAVWSNQLQNGRLIVQ